MEQTTRWAGVRLLSGGTAPTPDLLARVVSLAAARGEVVLVDAAPGTNLPGSLVCAVGTSQPRVWDRLLEAEADLMVVRMVRHGLPTAELRSASQGKRLWLLPSEPGVRQAVDFGWGVPPRAKVRRLCAELWRAAQAADG